MQQRFISTVVALFGITASLSAHVSLQPRESAPGATITYTVRVPTEGTVATTGVELEIPEAVSVISVEGAADTYEVKKTGDRIVSITWKTDIQPKQFKTFTFVAKNPATPSDSAWNARQRFADGTMAEWIEPAGSKRPAARTKVVSTVEKAPIPTDHKH